jgi:hypothetical protein
MRRPRVSIGRLMIVVLVVAVGTAALKAADEVWAGAMLTLTLGLLGVAVLGALFRREGRRAFWVGFALLGAAYLAPTLVEATRPKLPTSKLLAYAHSKLAPQDARRLGLVLLTDVGTTTDFVLKAMKPQAGDSAWTNARVTASGTFTAGQAANSNVTWTRLLSVVGDPEPFITVGHCLLALLAALVGGLVARAFHDGDRARRAEAG